MLKVVALARVRCMLLTMRRIQLHLDEQLDEALSRQALERGVPKAALIRELLSKAVPLRRGRGAEDPSSRLVAIYQGEEGESAMIDQVVYGA
jgi:hypothetical protein